MSTAGPEPGSLTARALALQAQHTEVMALLNQALAGIVNDPRNAYRTLPEVDHRCEEYSRSEEAFLAGMGPWGTDQIPQMKKDRLHIRVSVLFGQGQAAILLGMNAAARQHYEAALTLLGDEPDPTRPMIRAALAQLAAEEA